MVDAAVLPVFLPARRHERIAPEAATDSAATGAAAIAGGAGVDAIGGHHPWLRVMSKTNANTEGAGRRLLGRLLRAMGLGFGLAASASAAAQPAGQVVPEHWISYAQLASHQFQDWLSDADSAPVVRLHEWMQQRLLDQAPSMPPPPLVVSVWVAADGRVTRLEFTSLGHPRADADLRAVLTAQPLPEPPPADMRQPMRLQLSLDFAVAT